VISSPTHRPGSACRLIGLALAGVFLGSCGMPEPPGDAGRVPGALIEPIPAGRTDPGVLPPAGPSGVAAVPAAPPQAVAPRRKDPVIATGTHRFTSQGIAFTALTFDQRHFHLGVLDNGMGPGTGAGSARNAASSANGVAAINGGFFTPEGSPLGLVIENGTQVGSLNRSSLGAGMYFHDSATRSSGLIRRERWQQAGPQRPESLLQSGPFLLERGQAVPGLSVTRPRPRSFLLWDGRSGWVLGRSGSTTLAKLASALATQPVPGFTAMSALNLDGGSSSDLWIGPDMNGGPVSTRHFWNKSVRNYLVLTRATP
jgi:hypothetical protein